MFALHAFVCGHVGYPPRERCVAEEVTSCDSVGELIQHFLFLMTAVSSVRLCCAVASLFLYLHIRPGCKAGKRRRAEERGKPP